VPTFCRHNRFIERCPICRKTLPGLAPPAGHATDAPPRRTQGAARGRHPRLRAGGQPVRVRHELRAEDDGYRSELLPGVRASGEAARLAEEIAFANGRLLTLGAAPPDLYAEVRARAEADLEGATWMCFLIAYLSPLQGDDPFAGIRIALGGAARLPDLDGVPLGPRTSHDPARGLETLIAYRHWVQHAGDGAAGGGAQERAFTGDAAWSPQRRFERLFERLALPGLGRMGRYDLLVMLGRLGLYELRADSLHLVAATRGSAPSDPTMLAAKRVFAVGEPLYLERRALTFAEALAVPVETLDLALANWVSSERATLGFRAETCDRHALERAHAALGL
jgi:hypothetical protein